MSSAERVARSREAQGLPAKVSDPATLGKIAAIFAAAARDEAPPKRGQADTASTFAATSPQGGRRVHDTA